jgi:3',5'-cyclic AMP phosphodiesterase CpdA
VPSNNQAYYSFDIGNIHFVSLDSYGKDEKGMRMYERESAQVEWLKKDLEANKDKEWVVAYWHHPPYTKGSHDSDTEALLVNIREQFNQVVEDYGVDLVLCGHSHVYERTKLIKGHYGLEATFNAEKHNLSSSSGLYNGSKNSAPYIKDSKDAKGTVYVVSGSAGQLGGAKATYPHDAMYYSNNQVGGSLMLEVTGNKMDLKWICSDGKIRDNFTMMKDVKNKEKSLLKKDKILTQKAPVEKGKFSAIR